MKRKAAVPKRKRVRVSRRPRWKFSDGTIVHLGGEIVGTSAFADDLRSDLRDGVLVGFDPLPSGRGVEMDVNDLLHVDTWLQQEFRRPTRRDLALTLVERPDNVPEPPPSVDYEFDPDVVY